MATLLRRKAVLISLSHLSKSRQFSAFASKFQSFYLKKCPIPAKKYTKWNYFHTSQPAQKIVAFKLSDIGEGIREVVVKEWFVKVGDKVEQFENICEVQSDKAAVTITSRYDGVVTKLYSKVDEMVLVGEPLVDIEVQDEVDSMDEKAESPSLHSMDTKAPPQPDNELDTNIDKEKPGLRTKVLTTPAVRRIASQYSLDLLTVKATGRNGRVLKDDVLNHLNITSDQSNILPEPTTVQAQSLSLGVNSPATLIEEDKIVPVSGFTKAMVKSMTESLKIPHFVLSDEYDVTKLVQLRKELREVAEKRGIKLTYMPLIVKAASLALREFPILNSSLDKNCENVIYKAAHNIGIAMDTQNGLVVPVIKNVQRMSILEIAAELNRLQKLGAKGSLGLAEVSGGTFTISNIGNVGGTYTKPVILAPQVAIGALGKIQVLPRFDDNGAVTPAHIVNVSWSADHRVVDGVTMARFSNTIKHYLEQPNYFIIDL